MEQFRLFRGKSGCFFLENTQTRKQTSLRTRDKDEAKRLLAAKNEAHREPLVCLQIARAYLTAADPVIRTRTWQSVADTMAESKEGPTHKRWVTACKDCAFDLIRDLKLTETRAEQFWKVLKMGTVSTNTFLRRMHNFALDMNWILTPIIPCRQWPKIHFKEKRAITLEEHRRIVEREKNPERRAFYELAWHLGAAQSDLANLHAEDIDRPSQTLTFERMKLRHRAVAPPQIRFGKEVEAIFAQLPRMGPLFPYLRTVREADRATEFKQRCQGLGISGVTLHSYRYAWAERAKTCGYPERFVQMALGHNSKAVHRAYARKAQVTVPALEDYEKEFEANKVVPFSPVAQLARKCLLMDWEKRLAFLAVLVGPIPDRPLTSATRSIWMRPKSRESVAASRARFLPSGIGDMEVFEPNLDAKFAWKQKWSVTRHRSEHSIRRG